MFEEVKASDIQSAEYAALLDALLEAGYEPAIEHGVARLSILDESTMAVADVLLRRAPRGCGRCFGRSSSRTMDWREPY